MNPAGTFSGRRQRNMMPAFGAAILLPIMLGAIAAAAVAMVPVSTLEWLATSAGLSEILPAAAPPLGFKARVVLMAFAALMVAVGSALLLLHLQTSHSGPAPVVKAPTKEKHVGYAMTRAFSLRGLIAMARGDDRAARTDETGISRRRADHHPDAPPRAPLVASRDLPVLNEPESNGQPGFKRLPASPEPWSIDELTTDPAQMSALSQPRMIKPIVPDPAAHAAPAADQATPVRADSVAVDAGTQSIAALTARFESGMAKRIALRDADCAQRAIAAFDLHDEMPLSALPPAEPVAVRASVDAEIDAALQSALTTLRRMVATAR